MTRTRMWVVFGGLVISAALVAWWHRPTNADATAAVETILHEDVRRSARKPLPPGLDTVPEIDALPIAVIEGDGFGGSDLQVIDSLDAAIAKRDPDDPLLYDMKVFAFLACGAAARVAREPAHLDPNRAWAIDYLTRACVGYDEKTYTPFRRGQAHDLALAREMGEDIADKVALEQLRTAVSSAELDPASWRLLDSGKFPAQLPKGLTQGERLNAAALAVMPIRCRALSACGNQSLLTAYFCLQGCRPGVTLEEAVRSRMTPNEIDAAMIMRRGIVRLRTQPH